ncbi:hypothetical protein DPMN_188587 [Dreissena polymorpha]|uniref:Reverse transcriptase domain-containing protein n=1 Tax=Dreissena polymorpha TaxID=45954 RepID=A0A9D4DU27_DREPO|nr:hypothetical protein DPMN_188587 [Dreissena polymorpha]
MEFTGLWKQLEDLDFADDLAFLSNTQQQMQEKTNMVADNSARLGLTINRGKSNVSRLNASNNTPIQAQGEALRRWTASSISAEFCTTSEKRVQMSEPASVKHEQLSIT